MTTIVNTPGNTTDNSAGWAVAVVILLVVVAGGIFWYARAHRAPAAAPGATVQVNLPTGGSNNGGDSGGAPAQ